MRDFEKLLEYPICDICGMEIDEQEIPLCQDCRDRLPDELRDVD